MKLTKADLAYLFDLLKLASKSILEIYASNFTINKKSDASPVTQADVISQKIILERLSQRFGLPVVAEETVEQPVINPKQPFWLLDPLDGTKDFTHKNDEFTINLALIENQKPVFGLIHVPVTGDIYWAQKNQGAYKNILPIQMSLKRQPLIGTHSRFHLTDEDKQFFVKHNILNTICFGSALKFCKLAEGIVDIYPRFQGSSLWDTAAGQLLVEEAGGQVLDLVSGQPLCYNPYQLNNPFFVAGRVEEIL